MNRFDGFVGSEALIERLCALIKGGKMPRSVLLTAEDGCGRNLLSRMLAGEILNDSGMLTLRNEHPDCLMLSGSGAAGMIKTEDVRAVRSELYRAANMTDGARVCIVRNAGDLNRSSAAALLKVLEEPPADSYFILTARSRFDLIDTIASRCIVMPLEPLSPERCAEKAKELRPKASDLDGMSRTLAGRLGYLLRAADDAKFRDTVHDAERLAGYLMSRDRLNSLVLLSKYEKKQTLVQLLELTSLSLGYTGRQTGSADAARISEILNRSRQEVGERNASVKLAAANLVTRICR